MGTDLQLNGASTDTQQYDIGLAATEMKMRQTGRETSPGQVKGERKLKNYLHCMFLLAGGIKR